MNYTNLAPGNYTLKVRDFGNKVENGEPKEIMLDITIHSPWFATVWAFLVYFLVVASIVYSFWRVKMARRMLALSLAEEKNEKERIEEVNKMKLRFFTNISHEFRTPLTLIIGQVEMLLQMEKLAPVVNKRLRGIHKNAINLLPPDNGIVGLQEAGTGIHEVESGARRCNFFREGHLSAVCRLCP